MDSNITATTLNIPPKVKDYLEYNSDTGILTWIKSPVSNIPVGTQITRKNKQGYNICNLHGVTYYVHRVGWYLHTNSQPPEFIDHINRIKTDNYFSNLREATKSQNRQNIGIQRNNSSGYKGVSWKKEINKWVARIMLNNVSTHLGYFATPEEAYEAYISASKKFYKEFSFV